MDPLRPEQLTIYVDPGREHHQGPLDAAYLLVEYGDFECPFSLKAGVRVDRLRRELGDRLCFIYRHLPLTHKHPHAQLAAEAAEAAAAQGRFWEMSRTLFRNQDALGRADLVHHAQALELDLPRFAADLDERRWEETVRRQAEGGRMLGAGGTPAFVIDGRLYVGPYEPEDLKRALAASAAGPVGLN